MADLDALKDIPGYKAILKSVLKSQIQLLLEQLSDQTGEESMILTASVHDGSLSHLGSCTGKGFLEGREEIKSQFLGYCLKTHHRAKAPEPRATPYQRTGPRGLPHKKARLQSSYPVSSHSDPSNRYVSQSPPSMSYDTGGGSFQAPSGFSRDDINYGMDSNSVDLQGSMLLTGGDRNTSNASQIKQEHVNTPTMAASTGAHHTQSLGEGQDLHQAETLTEDQDNSHQSGAQGPDMNLDTVNIKMESVDESDLEITGVEMLGAVTPESWSQSSGTMKEQGLEDNGDESEYNCLFGSDQIGQTQRSKTEHICPDCNKSFKARSALIRHVRIHTGEKPYPCLHCADRFNRKHHLMSHMVSKHGNFLAQLQQTSDNFSLDSSISDNQ